MTDIEVGKVAMVPINDIIIGERARIEMGDLEGLENSLKASGLIQPLAVLKTPEGLLLLAGERRYTILLKNQVKEIPVRIYEKELSDLEIKVIEKSENFHRKDMEYFEYDNLIREIHELEQAIKGVPAPGPTGGSGHSLKDTAAMFGVTNASISTAIKRAEAREAFPELFEKCKTQKDASNVIKKIDEAAIKSVIAEKLEREQNINGNKLIKLSKCFINANFFEGVKKIPNGVFHLIEVDPPYAIGLNEIKKSTNESIYQQDQYNEIKNSDYMNGNPLDPDNPWKGMNQVFKECYRVMSDHAWLLCWFAPEPWFEIIFNALISAGFSTTRMCGVWIKGHGQSQQPADHLSNSYEMFFYAKKGKPALNKPGRSNVFVFPPVLPQNKTHPTERPVELIQEIYDTFAFPGSRVFIPFLGSGSGIFSADKLGMSVTGFELGKSYRDSFLVKAHGMGVC